MTSRDLDASTIAAAQARIKAYVRPLTLRQSPALSKQTDGTATLVLENEQPTGSFKIRGAANAVLAHLEHGVTGFTTASTGNHARAVAHMCNQHRVPLRAYVSRDVSAARVRSLKELSATVDASTASQSEAIERAQAYAAERGHAFVPPFDDPYVISGQGTLGLDLVSAMPELDVVVVPVSGGGLASGIALAVKSALPRVRVIGVCAERAPAMRAALEAGRPVEVRERETVADSLRGDLGPDNRHTFRLVRDLVDDVALVSEDALLDAQRLLAEADGVAAEGAGAAATAFVRSDLRAFAGRSVTVIVSGAADTTTLQS